MGSGYLAYRFSIPYVEITSQQGTRYRGIQMLVEFSVKNHRVFREKQTFSMVASETSARAGIGHATGFAAMPRVHREACFFGANGSGKSSLVNAMSFMENFVRTSFRREAGEPIPVEPFLFHSVWRRMPSEFEAIFIQDETRYQYGFSLTHERVVEEWLFARPLGANRQRTIFTRTYDEKDNSYLWDMSGIHLKSERYGLRSYTRPDSLLLSVAVQLGSEYFQSPYDWFRIKLRPIELNSFINSTHYTLSRFNEDEWKRRVMDFLEEFDISPSNITVREQDIYELPGFNSMTEQMQKAFLEQQNANPKMLTAEFEQLDEQDNPVAINILNESSGTISLLALSGFTLDVLENGYVFVVDDLNFGLHPHAFNHIVAMFNDKELNNKEAQLIFTTHETSVTEGENARFGNDQIWMIEKDDDLSSTLIPLLNFKSPARHSFSKNYLQGRYGAVPRIRGR